MKNLKLNVLVKASLLSAMCIVLMFIEISIPIFPDFLKLDASDLPALIGGFAFGPVVGIIIEFVKNLIRGLLMTQTAFIGEAANFLIGAVLVGTASLIYKYKKDKVGAVLGMVIATIVMSLVAAILNYTILIPVYSKAFGAPIEVFVDMANKVNSSVVDFKTLIIWSIIPFNLLKGAMVSGITMLLYKPLSPLLKKENRRVQYSNKNAKI